MSNAENNRFDSQRSAAFAEQIDAMQEQVRANLGADDRRYITRLIRLQRLLVLTGRLSIFASLALLPLWSHGFASWAGFGVVITLGTLLLAVGKILENMEIGHNVLHGQWDWMNDPQIHSNSWEWDHACPASQWRHSHNYEHHTWTNVLGKDRDIGYGMLRVTTEQRWHPFYLLQPLNVLLMALFFEVFIALHDLNIARVLKGKDDREKTRRKWREIKAKVGKQALKDYLLWPLLAGPLFPIVLAANLAANILRNLWTFAVIFCGHFPEGVSHFTQDEVHNESRGDWYRRQILGSCNIRGGRWFHVLTGNLSHQIEHHVFPDVPSNHYAELAQRLQAVCEQYDLPYNAKPFYRQLGSTLSTLLRLTLPSRQLAA